MRKWKKLGEKIQIGLGLVEKSSKDGKAEESIPSLSILQLFRFASPLDVFLIFIGTLAAVVGGLALPAMTILFGDTLQAFVDYSQFGSCNETTPVNGSAYTPYSPLPSLERYGWGMAAIGLIIWLDAYIFVVCFNTAANRQIRSIRTEYLKAILRQDIGWYDSHASSSAFCTKMSEELNRLEAGIGEKLGMLVFFWSSYLVAHIVAFVYGWELTLVLMAVMPAMSVAGSVLARAQTSLAAREAKAYAAAGAFAEEMLAGVRTVAAFCGEKNEVATYRTLLAGARRAGILRGAITGLSGGLSYGICFATYGLAFWVGIRLMTEYNSDLCVGCKEDDTACLATCARYTPRVLLTVFYSVLLGGWNLGQAAPFLEAVNSARSAAATIFWAISRVPVIDSANTGGIVPPQVSGDLAFDKVYFAYPTRPDVEVLRGFSLRIPAGRTVALVGGSGGGKSTCVQLLQRFYDPLYGAVTLDGMDLRLLNLAWLRSQIAVVGQEPALFDLTIRENLLLGNPGASQADLEAVLRAANAWDFVSRLPSQLDTLVGQTGAQLSGGQKQRIAIARALVRRPRILLLDEATSALDTASEGEVQVGLENMAATMGATMTTVVIAHRLSTVVKADLIVVIKDGEVKETGTHEQLMAKSSLYQGLVGSQLKDPHRQLQPEAVDCPVEEKADSSDSQEFEKIMVQQAADNGGVELQEEVEKMTKVGLGRLLAANRPEWPYILAGVLASVAMGGAMALFSVLFGAVARIVSYEDGGLARAESVHYAGMFCLLGLASTLIMALQGLFFGISGQELTMRLRVSSFAAMLRQEMTWFDRPENSTGTLCARLSGDASEVQGATGAKIGTILQALSGMVIGLVVGLTYNWKLGLVCCLFFPFSVLAVFLEAAQAGGSRRSTILESASHLASEAVSNIRTVAGLGCEAAVVQRFSDSLAAPEERRRWRLAAHKRGGLFGYSQAAQYFGWGLTAYYGGTLVVGECMPYQNVYLITNAIIGSAAMIGHMFSFTADFGKAMAAATRVFRLLDRRPTMEDGGSAAGLLLNSPIKGEIKLDKVDFWYPTRGNVRVLENVSLSIHPGQRIALVGESGSGKTTIMHLLQRLYNPTGGKILLEGQDIGTLNVPFVRAQLGLVSQEPTLFNRSIADNIKYGDNSRCVSMEEVMTAARSANIHNFITSLPNGYQTRVGLKGTQLSGGQKQRIAIARALVRNPRILLLDEATSALDTESESVVQEALNRAQQGRTTITIAHRLSTVRDADKIFVIRQGRITEEGSHDQLLQKNGFYRQLWST